MSELDSLVLAALIEGEAVPIGEVQALKFKYAPKIKEIEICNMISSGIFDVKEEAVVLFEVKMSYDKIREVFGGFIPISSSDGAVTALPRVVANDEH